MTDAPARNEAVRRVRAVIDRLIEDGSIVASSDGATHDVRAVAVPADEGDALVRWVYREKAVHTIEVGLAYGLSALHICEGLLLVGHPEARHTVLDPAQRHRFSDCGLQVLEEAGVAHLVEHRAELSQIALPRLLEEPRRFDLAFIDGNHRFDAVFLDLFYLGHLVKRSGIIVLDDYKYPGIRKAVDFWIKNLGWRVEEEAPEGENGSRWVVLRTADSEDHRHFRYFVDF